MLDFRKQYNVPVWLGETGENSNVWFTEIIELLDKNNIGWAFWPMKILLQYCWCYQRENYSRISKITRLLGKEEKNHLMIFLKKH